MVMTEFNNRISAQRDALKVINGLNLYKEPLFSLTEKAIDRWVSNNQIDAKEIFVILIKDVSKKLFFLSNKSQEQITEEYQNLSKEVMQLIKKIKTKMTNTPLESNTPYPT